MSVPFSNTHLRVPRGFATILNGLVREVLRDQPEDIPKYAAQHFSSLLKQRQESGLDTAEWAARLEDRYNYNRGFEDTEAQRAPASEETSAAKTTTSIEKCNDSKTGEESSRSRDVSGSSTIQQDAPEGAGEEEEHDITERLNPTDKLCEAESLDRELDAEEPGGAAEQNPSGILDPANEKEISRVSREDVDHSDLEFSGISPGVSDGAACVSSPTAAEDQGSDKEWGPDQDVVDPNGKTGAEEQAEVFPHSGCPEVDAFAASCEEKESTMEGSAVTDDGQEGDEDTNLKSETERPEDNQHEADDQAGGTEEVGRSQTCSEERHERLSDIEGSNTHKGDTLVEVSFEDLPEAQDMKQFEPEEADAVEGSHTNMEKQPLEESKGVAAAAPHQNVPVTQDGGEHEMVGVEREVNSEEKEMENQQGASVMKGRADTNDSGLSDGEDEVGQGDKVVSSSDQPAATPEKDNPEYEKGHAHEGSLKRGEGESQERDPDSEGAEMAGVQKGDEEDASQQGRRDAGAETLSPQATRSNSSTGAPEAEAETVETSVQHLAEEDKGQRTAEEDEPEVTALEEETPKSSEVVDEAEPARTNGVHPDPPADEGERGHLGQDTLGPEDNSGEKQEDCSRPQEEEDIMDIPLDDPEANRAAAKIQAGFRGHMTRKKLKPEDKAEGEERQDDRAQ